VTALSTGGTARERFLAARGESATDGVSERARRDSDADDFEPAYLGWELARCAAGLADDERRAVAALAAACVLAMRAGSTRLPVDEAGRDDSLAAALAQLGAGDRVGTARALLARARIGDAADPVTAVIGRPGQRKPLLLDGGWLYPERMRTLEDRFCKRVRDRIARPVSGADARSVGRALAAVTSGPPALTEEQKRAVREGLVAPLALVTGGPGTGKTTIVVALLRALAWTGAPMEAVAIAAPTGKAARRLHEAITAGLASASGDIGEAGLRLGAPLPQTLHRLLGWSPASARFARHENDPLPHRVVIVDEASMVDLAMMDRLMRALSADARVVLLGDADQLPSVEAGAVFRDLCAALRSVRLSTNLRVGSDAAAQRIVGAARAVNAGKLDARFTASVETRRTVREIAFEGVEHLAAPWAEVGDALLDRYWRERVVPGGDFLRRAARVYRAPAGVFDEAERAELDALFAHHARTRLLCVTRVRAIPTSADAINERLLARLHRGAVGRDRAGRGRGSLVWAPGAPAMVERNDYEHDLHNGDQGVVVRVDRSDARGRSAPELMAVFRHGESFRLLPVEGVTHLSPAFAMTVHKAQGSEFDDVVLVLPDADGPSWTRLLTRELLYTAMTRARRSVLFVGPLDLLARATSRTVERHSGVAERLTESPV
jgi:exodeoxyribonuclease V alpha subunit